MAATPDTSLSLELDPSLSRLLDPDNRCSTKILDGVKAAVDDLINLLGIPGEAQVTMTVAAEPLADDAALRLSANGQRCRFPSELSLWVHHYCKGVQAGVEEKPAAVASWLRDPETELDQIVEFVTVICVEILKNQPAVLLQAPQAAAYLAALTKTGNVSPALTRTESVDALLPVLSTLLELRISLADTERLAEGLEKGQKRSKPDLAEDLIGLMQREVVEIQIDTEYLKQITNSDPQNAHGMFSFLREGLFAESGVIYPRFRFVPTDSLKPFAFAFKVNDLTTLPMLGLSSNQCIVNDTPEHLEQHGLKGTPTLNPASAQPGSLIRVEDGPAAEAAKLTTWNDLQY